MILADRTIRELVAAGRLAIEPFDHDCVQPASVDVRLGTEFRVMRNNRVTHIDPRVANDALMDTVQVPADEPFVLHPGEFALAVTYERVRLPNYIVGRLEGKSSLGRLGLLVHSTAGYVDPGWDGALTLELSNVANLPIALYEGMKVSQLSFLMLTEPAKHAYGSKEAGSKYQGQEGPTPSRYYLNFR